MKPDEPRVALVHYWLVSMRGGERVLEALCDVFPNADIFTHVVDPQRLSEKLRGRPIHTTFISRLPRARRWYKNYLPLMPAALEALDLSGYDLVISSESGPAKGVITDPGTLHVCYCHSPMRYLWDLRHEYAGAAGPLTRAAQTLLGPFLRSWDVQAAARVDHFVANSSFVARRIERYYGRSARVIHPPVDTEAFDPTRTRDDFYLMAGQLTAYKKPELVIEAFRDLPSAHLVVIGEGELLKKLRRTAPSNVEVLGHCPFPVLKDHMERCRALIFPGVEDFGIVPVEAMAAGAPVIAYRRGGVTETVVDGVTGLFFEEQTPAAILDAIRSFEEARSSFDSQRVAEHAAIFDTHRFKTEISEYLEGVLPAGSPAV